MAHGLRTSKTRRRKTPQRPGKSQQEIQPITNFPIASADTVGVVRIKGDSGLVIDEEGFLSLAKPDDGR